MSSDAYARLLEACQQTQNTEAYVAGWRADNPQGRVVGFFPTYIPLEIIAAANALPVGIWGGPIPVSHANALIQQFTCSIVRTTTEYALTGAFDFMDAVLFPPICDAVKMVSSSWKLNLSDRFFVDMVNFPERLDSESAVRFLTAELRRVTNVLSERLERSISDEDLRSAISICNRVRALQEQFYRWRQSPSSPQTCLSDVCTILKAGTVMEPAEYANKLEAFLAATDSATPPPSQAPAVPIVVTGLSCQLPHTEFLRLFDSAGLKVVDDDLFFGMRACGQVASDGDPYEALARGYAASAPMATRYHSQRKRHELLLSQIQHGGAKGVVFLIPKFCEPEWFDLRYLKQEMDERSIPNLSIDFEEDLGITGPAQTRLEAFAETLA